MTAYTISKKNWLGVTFSLLIAVMIPIACIGVSDLCDAAETDCEKLLSQEAFKKLDKEQIETIQKNLIATGYDPNKVDGVIGKHTGEALNRFCADFSDQLGKESAENFMATLALYADIAGVDPEKYPEWKEIALSDDFKSWINKHPDEKRAEICKIKDTGIPRKIISLYETYKAYRDGHTEPRIDVTDDYTVSYKLTESDLVQLSAKDDIAVKLDSLKDKSYDDKNDFIKAVQEAVELPKDEFDLYKDLIINSAQQDRYELTEQSLESLKKKIPVPIIGALQEIENKLYPDEEKFKAEVGTIIEKETEQFDQYLPSVLKYAKVEEPYSISEKFLQRLSKRGVADDLIAKLKALPVKQYPDIDSFEKAIRPFIVDVTINYNFPDPVLSELFGLRAKLPENQRKEADKKIQEVIKKYYEYQKIILEEIEELPLYILTDQSYVNLEKGGIPDYLNNKLHELKYQGYTDNNFFEIALKNKIAELVKGYKNLIAAKAKTINTYQLTELYFKKLQRVLKDQKIPGLIIEVLKNLEDVEYPNQNLFKNMLEYEVRMLDTKYLPIILQSTKKLATSKLTAQAFENLDDELKSKKIPIFVIEWLQAHKSRKNTDLKKFTEEVEEDFESLVTNFNKYKPKIIAMAKKKYRFSDYKKELILWTAKSCGCVLDDLSGVVYGFYPFWMAGDQADKKKAGEPKSEDAENPNNQNEEDKSPKQELDFSVLTRVGYYALSFDEKGDFYEQLPWAWEPKGKLLPWEKTKSEKTAEKAAEFLREARKYRTDIDMVIYQKDWLKWSKMADVQKSIVFDNLLKNIVKLVKIGLTDTFSMIKPYISLGGSSIPTIADGVTLYFENYPEDNTSKDLFLKFIKELRKNLKALRKDYHLNIMLQMDAIGKGVYGLEMLKQFIPAKGEEEQNFENQGDVDYFLVFIAEPTKETKKTLRENVEKLFSGMQRRTMLRKIIPIITPTGHDKQQLEDDLVYIDDNFGGVGFWVLPISDGSGVDFITCAKEIFLSSNTQAEENPPLAEVVNTYLTKFYRKKDAPVNSGYKNFVTLHRWEGRVLFDLLVAIIAIYALLSAFICWFRVILVRFFWWFMSVVLLFIWVFFSLLYYDPSWKNLAEGNLILFLVILIIAVIAIFGFVKKSKQGELP